MKPSLNKTPKANLANRSLGTSPFFMSKTPTEPLNQNSMHLDLERTLANRYFRILKSRYAVAREQLLHIMTP